MFYRNLLTYIGVHATNVFESTTNQHMKQLVDYMGMSLQRPHKTMDCLRGSTQLATYYTSDMEIDQAELHRAARGEHS